MTLNDVNDDYGSILIVRGDEIAALLERREQEVMDGVADAYRIHAAGDSSLPHSSFLRFPGDDLSRIITLPAYLGGGYGVAGIKWIASFPANVQRGEARASATLILNSTETGQSRAILEGLVISARRTAASTALAAREMARPEVCQTINGDRDRLLDLDGEGEAWTVLRLDDTPDAGMLARLVEMEESSKVRMVDL